jgi:ethanolamine utilization microcompartment shell protein EutS
LGQQGLSLYVRSILFAKKMSASAVELGFLDDFLGPSVLVFVNGFSVRCSLCAQKMSASAVELGFLDDFWVPGT